MIYMRLELWPGGNRSRMRILSEGLIHLTGAGGASGSYEWLFSKVGGFKASDIELRTVQVKNVLRRGELHGFPRRRLYGHDLLLRALKLAFGERNP